MAKSLLFSSPILEGSGYGSAGRSYVSCFDKAGVDLAIHPTFYSLSDPTKYVSDVDRDLMKKYLISGFGEHYDIFMNHATPDLLTLNSFCNLQTSFSVWETDRIPESSVSLCNNMDMIFTASEYSKFAFLNAGVKTPVHVIPHVVELKDYKKENVISSLLKDKKVFLSVFEWHIGKGYDLLIKGFLETFKDNKDVILILKVNDFVNPKTLKSKVISYISELKTTEYPKILPIAGPCSSDFLYSLYDVCDFYISTSRREAFSLTLAEAAIRNKVIIAPDKGGHREFLHFDNAALFDSEYQEVSGVELERSNYRNQKWIEPNYESFLIYLKAAYEEWGDPTEIQKKMLQEETLKIREHLSSRNVINMFRKHLDI